MFVGADLPRPKIHSPIPYFFLSALFVGTGLLNHRYPAFFFPSLPLPWVWGVSLLGGLYGLTVGLRRGWGIAGRRKRALALVTQMAALRRAAESPAENDVIIAGRYIARLNRNADEDLREIKPDYSIPSLKRLQRYLPELLDEIENEGEARVRLGVVGTYLGETLCRNFHWEWFFKTDPALRQFSYLVSIIRKQGKEWDPFAAAAGWFAGKCKMRDLLKEIQE